MARTSRNEKTPDAETQVTSRRSSSAQMRSPHRAMKTDESSVGIWAQSIRSGQSQEQT